MARQRFALVYVDQWNEEEQELVTAGRCIDRAATAEEALELYYKLLPVCRRWYGAGELVILDCEDDYCRVALPRLAALATEAVPA